MVNAYKYMSNTTNNTTVVKLKSSNSMKAHLEILFSCFGMSDEKGLFNNNSLHIFFNEKRAIK